MKTTALLDMRMGASDMIAYHGVLTARLERAKKAGDKTAVNRLTKYMQVAEAALDVVFAVTIEESAPKLLLIAGIDIHKESLVAAMPLSLDAHKVTDTTQLEVKFEDAEVVVETELSIEDQIKKLMSRKFTDSIEPAIKLFQQQNPECLFPSDAWNGIKTLCSGVPHFKVWESYIARQYRERGPIAAFYAVKKHIPSASDTEISRIVEQSIRRAIDSGEQKKYETQLLMQLESPLDAMNPNLWKADSYSRDLVSSIFNFDNIKDKASITKQAGRLVAVMNPQTRESFEKKARKPYVEEGKF